MTDFNTWFNQKIKPMEAIEDFVDTSGIDECLIEDDGTIATQYACCVCEEYSDINCDPWEFDPDMHYCGGSPSCCP